ncbi:MAG TPA: hypothetical protein VGP47_08040 [Parachlamydiaceae bacterium]|nr:hypothetical protein [Parachlamydiaceae bacterium]
MATLTLTLAIAFVIIMIALALMGISWLITGKLKMKPGACGRDPTKNKEDENCGTGVNCHLCKKPESNKKK